MYNLLIVDDEEHILDGLSRCFPWDEVGFRVSATAGDGQEALLRLRDVEVDVILTDIRMPRMDGIDLARAIHRQRLDIPIVFLSAFEDFHYAQQAIRFGVRGYVLKPTQYAELRSTFSELKKELDALVVPSQWLDGGRTNEDNRLTRAEAIAETVKDFVFRNYARATLSGAARIVHMNEHYLSRVFNEVTGVPFREFLLNVKMKKATELLQDVDYTVAQVSEIVGYQNPKNFSRSFKRHYGVSPRGYQNPREAGHPETS